MHPSKEFYIGFYSNARIYDQIEEMKSRRRGRDATKSAVINDILDYFFAMDDAQIQNALHLRSNEPIAVADGEAKVSMKTCARNPRHQWIADIDYCPYCAYTPEQRAEYLRASGGQS
jgi:hypothetical protein